MSHTVYWATRVVSVIAVAGLLLGSGSAALAATPQEGFWYFDTYGVQDAHDAGITGAGVTIAVLDSQINLEVPTLRGADIEVQPSSCFDESGVLIPPTSTSVEVASHGTNVASFIVGSGAGYPGQSGVKGVAPKAKVLYFMAGPSGEGAELISCRDDDGQEPESGSTADYVNRAVEMGADIISVSLSVFPHDALVQAVANAEHHGVVIVASLPNHEFAITPGLGGAWPAVANGAVAVQRMDTNAVVPVEEGRPFDARVVVAGPGQDLLYQGSTKDGLWQTQSLEDGTSFATPVVASFLALVKQKYPKATGNQLIQTLINNTGAEDHALEFSLDDGLGYGVASVRHMLRVDPTQYPDVNPLVRTGAGLFPSAEMIANGPPVKASPTAPPTDTGSMAVLVPWVIGGVIFFLVVIGAIILVVVLASRRAKRPPSVGSEF